MITREEQIQEVVLPEFRRKCGDWVSVLVFGELVEGIMALLVLESVDTHSISVLSEIEDSVSRDIEELEHEVRVVIKPLGFRPVLVVDLLEEFDPVRDGDKLTRFRSGNLLKTLPESFHGLTSIGGLDRVRTIDFTDFLKKTSISDGQLVEILESNYDVTIGISEIIRNRRFL